MTSRAAILIAASLALAGCMGRPLSANEIEGPTDELLVDVLRTSVQALLDKDADYLVDHHSDSFCQTQDGEQVTRAEFRKSLERLFASEQWDQMYGRATTPDQVWRLDAASIRNVSELQGDPEWAKYEDICDFRPSDQSVVIPKADGSAVPDNFTGIYRLREHHWVRVGA
jgi:hypothetical protein